MKQSAVWLYILLGFATVLWLFCLVQVLFMPKFAYNEPHISATVSYPSTYKSSSAIHLISPSSHKSPFSTVSVPAPSVTMQSTSQSVSNVSMRVKTISSRSVQEVGGGGAGASMNANSASNGNTSRGIVYSQVSVSMPVQGLLTSASMVGGGMTASETYARMSRASSPHQAPSLPPGVCDQCHWVWDGEKWVCSVCGEDALDGCTCADEYGYCRCPIEDGMEVWLFLTLLAGAYVVHKARARRAQTI